MFIQINLEELEFIHKIIKGDIVMASKWLTDTLALINTIAVGAGTDPKVTKAIDDLNTRLTSDEVTENDLVTAVTALTQKLASSTPPTGALPVVAAVSPTTGDIAGAQAFTVTGTGFTGATAVNFVPSNSTAAAVPATSISVPSDGSATFTSPALAAGVYDVVVVTPAGASAVSTADQITFS